MRILEWGLFLSLIFICQFSDCHFFFTFRFSRFRSRFRFSFSRWPFSHYTEDFVCTRVISISVANRCEKKKNNQEKSMRNFFQFDRLALDHMVNLMNYFSFKYINCVHFLTMKNHSIRPYYQHSFILLLLVVTTGKSVWYGIFIKLQNWRSASSILCTATRAMMKTKPSIAVIESMLAFFAFIFCTLTIFNWNVVFYY